MSANIWISQGSLTTLTSFITLVFLTGCSGKYQHAQNGSNFSYYPGQNSSYYNTNKKPEKLKKVDGSAAMHRATLRPYSTFGIKYFPKVDPVGEDLYGIASWYGPKFHGKKTSSGEVYNMHAMTAAHKTLPMHTIVDVTHRKSGKKVRVRVNDRGPFVKGRIIDLSYTAGKKLGLDKTGIAPVKVEVVKYDKYISSYNHIQKKKPKESFGVQLASFVNKSSADNVKEEASIKYDRDIVLKTIQKGDEVIYRVVVDGFSSRNRALNFMKRHALNSAVVITY